MEYKKHVGIYSTEEELQNDLINLVIPWVAYVSAPEGGFKVYYSDEVSLGDGSTDVTNNILNRLQTLEDKMVTLTEDEYDTLVAKGKTTITEVDGTIRMEEYDPSKYYYTYDPSDRPNE
jgi:hypothetical protein